MKSKGMMMALAAMMMAGENGISGTHQDPVTDEEIAQAKIRLEQERKWNLFRGGAKEFQYPQGTIIARDQKNADRKARNKGWI